jgi:hypothetical protein
MRVKLAVALALVCSCAKQAPPAPLPDTVTDATDWVEAPEAAGATLTPAWFDRAPDDLGLDFVHAGGDAGLAPSGPGVVLFDANNDARLDVYITDGAPSEAQGASGAPMGRLYMMELERFVERTHEAGLALPSLAARALGARAVDYDGDGDWDLLVSFPDQDRLMRNEGGRFTDVSANASVARDFLADVFDVDGAMVEASGTTADRAPTRGTSNSSSRALFDANLDGHLDLLTLDGASLRAPGQSGAISGEVQRPRLYLGTGALREVVDASASSGPVFDSPIAGRSLVFGDLDGDLDVDVIVTESDGPAQVWLNQNPSGHRPLRLVLLSKPPNTFALGAEVTVTGNTGDAAQVVHLGRRYFSQNEHTLTFGLGAARAADVTVRWPDGRTTEHSNLALGPTHVLH